MGWRALFRNVSGAYGYVSAETELPNLPNSLIQELFSSTLRDLFQAGNKSSDIVSTAHLFSLMTCAADSFQASSHDYIVAFSKQYIGVVSSIISVNCACLLYLSFN